jgi:branched-chain amino acid transport system ATP-binding protein
MLLSVEKINSYYGKSHILYDVSLNIDKGESVALLGRNGAGKTTTMNSIIGLLPPKDGEVIFAGEDLAGLKPDVIVRKGISLVPDTRRIFPNLTVLENLYISERKTPDGKWNIPTVFELFPELERLKSSKGRELSGGEQQMLAIARSLIGNHKLLLLDEPFEGLAPIIVKKIAKTLLEIQKTGISLLIVEHNFHVALEIASRCYVIASGKIVFEGASKALIESPELQDKLLAVGTEKDGM